MSNIKNILNCLQHRYPFLLVDKVVNFNKNKSITVIKNVTINEFYFQGHFDSHKIVPGVLIIESIAQSAGIFLFKSNKLKLYDHKFYLVGIDKTKFKKIVIPGDQMIISVVLDQVYQDFYRFIGTVYVKDDIVCQSNIICVYRI
ncbi:MAG: 3-hydroxyacyl-ACP dehydratase FabZ [Buchnera aphidicola (Eriosoma harunire)]